jgi:hypothetical protein
VLNVLMKLYPSSIASTMWIVSHYLVYEDVQYYATLSIFRFLITKLLGGSTKDDVAEKTKITILHIHVLQNN